MKRGILIFDQSEQEWRIWIGYKRYWVQQGDVFELFFQGRYLTAYVEKDIEWFITVNDELKFILHPFEVYKVRIQVKDYLLVDAPF